jgi:hypothetical protein
MGVTMRKTTQEYYIKISNGPHTVARRGEGLFERTRTLNVQMGLRLGCSCMWFDGQD